MCGYSQYMLYIMFSLRNLCLGKWIKIGQLIGLLLLSGCSTPSQRLDEKATDFGFSAQVVRGTDFQHRVYANLLGVVAPVDTLHVYLEGDGTPWVGNNRVIAADPTPRSPLMLELMAQDKKPAIYLGRPCYHGFSDASGCSPEIWTNARYSDAVVGSMAQVLRERVTSQRVEKLMLFGHSGGGVLAVLLAKRLPQTQIVVTMGANLDINAWTDLHGYSPLTRSLNPALEPALQPTTAQLHLVGERDRNVPPSSRHAYLKREPDAQEVVIPGYDHVCCWRDFWPQVLDWVEAMQGQPQDQGLEMFLNQ
jgi:dienelactone hydrolase